MKDQAHMPIETTVQLGDWTTCSDPECREWKTCTKARACLSQSQTTQDGRPNYCLHDLHPDPKIEAKAREIFMAKNARMGGWWELVETPEHWWDAAVKDMTDV